MYALMRHLASHYIPTGPYLRLCYRWRLGRWPNLRNPATLTEKLNWMKMHAYRPFHTTVSDKYAVRPWVAKRVGDRYLVPLIDVLDRAEDLDLDRLPDAFVVKTTHASGQNVIVRDKCSVQETQMRTLLAKWMRHNEYYLSREPQYRDIRPRLIVEELMVDSAGNVPMDFKLHCFHGTVEMIQVDIDRFSEHRRNFYSPNWQLLPFTWSFWKGNRPLWPNGRTVERPARLEEMIGLAETLAREFDYVRVDLYDGSDGVRFGELTLHHGGGWERFDPARYDLAYGEKLHLRTI